MSLTKETKQQVMSKFQKDQNDTGSVEVQVSLLTESIKRLTTHLQNQKKDVHGQRGLLKMVNQRRRLLRYLKDEDPARYMSIIQSLNLRESL
jgi:small subunit ribosomal protein S15